MSPLEWVIAIGAASSVVIGLWRWGWPLVRKVAHTFRAIVEVILGRPPVLDHATGRELDPEVLGVGRRMDRSEENQRQVQAQLAEMTKVLTALAEDQLHQRVQDKQIALLDTRVTRLEITTTPRSIT